MMPKKVTKPAKKATQEINLTVRLTPEEIREAPGRLQRTIEDAVIHLWQAGELSTRAAAERLGLTYRDYLDLLSERSIPVVAGELDEGRVQRLVEEAKARRGGE